MILTRPADAGACVYLGDGGCTIAQERRPATCNFYVCESALDAGGESAGTARRTRDLLENEYARWDAELATLLEQRSPHGLVFDAETLDWLGTTLAQVAHGA